MIVPTLVILFLLRIRFSREKSIGSIVFDRYGVEAHRKFRLVEKLTRKLHKCENDINFLDTCNAYDVIPKFLRIKLYRRDLEHSASHRDYQKQLLEEEIRYKIRNARRMREDLNSANITLHEKVSWIDSACLNLAISRKQSALDRITKGIHDKKLFNLGVCPIRHHLDPDLIITNLSNRVLSQAEIGVLMLGLEFAIPIKKLNYFRYYLCFEKMAKKLQSEPIYDGNNTLSFDTMITGCKTIAQKYFSQFRPEKNPVFNKKHFKILKNLVNDKSIRITSPDKGRGIVILNAHDYHDKLDTILLDTAKFSPCSENDEKLVQRLELKLNTFLRKIKSQNIISEMQYKQLYASGSYVGDMYGLAKVHKVNVPLRPIVSTYKTHNYDLGKFIAPMISHLAKNDYVLKNSYQFANEVSGIKNAENFHMSSFDIESLYTNVPVSETIDIILKKIFLDNVQTHFGFNRIEFQKLLNLALQDSYFRFNGRIFKQLEGLSMGAPLSPIIANIFLCDLEEKALQQCEARLRPHYYRRYLDDTFILFDSSDQSVSFFDFFNGIHPNIKFTCENESDHKLSFLDLNISKNENNFVTSIFRKQTFSGKGTNYFSFMFEGYKVSAITTLLYRAYEMSSTPCLFQKEVEFLKKYFYENNFPTIIFEKTLQKFLSYKLDYRIKIDTVCKMKIYFELPFIGRKSDNMKKELKSLITNHYPHIEPSFYFKSGRKIASFFPLKDKTPIMMESGVIYTYTCDCSQSYIGSTATNLYIRICQHRGISCRTKEMLKKPVNSSIRDHCSKICKISVNPDNFSIIDRYSRDYDLRILESIYIKKCTPSINECSTAVPLLIC